MPEPFQFDEEVLQMLKEDLFKGFIAGVVSIAGHAGGFGDFNGELSLGNIKYKVTVEPSQILDEQLPGVEKTMFEEMRQAGSSLPDMVEYLQAHGWETFEHHDNWIKTEWKQQPDFNPRSQGYDTHHAYKLAMQENSGIKEAVILLQSELKNDKQYFYSWKANIAMSFIDEWNRQNIKGYCNREHLHIIANTAADNFLNLLIKE